jgi:hypothetical protein
MADKLLVRAYFVEVGDCIYCRIPKGRKVGGHVDDFHILIDCGSKGAMDNLRVAITDLQTLLPDAGGGKRRLDLLVATHEHEDHISGFDPALFDNIKIESIWMNTAMNPKHPQAKKAMQLDQLATTAMRNIASLNLALSPELEELVALYSVSNATAMDALRTTLPKRNGIKPTYVRAGDTGVGHGLPLNNVKITVVGPEQDIDRFYLGKEADDALHNLAATGAAFRTPMPHPAAVPSNIGQSDFRRLQSRMMSTAFAFAALSSTVKNNTSVVLLIEWKGKRLLFVGDAEWDKKFKDGKANGAWNVMWHERQDMLKKPLDFLKIGHHGSENATPWNDLEDGTVTEPSTILDAVLPLPAAGKHPTAKAVVSTMRKDYPTIPRSALLAEIGKRVKNVRNYQQALGTGASGLPNFTAYEKQWLKLAQPMRTDCEMRLPGGKAFVDVELDA